MAYISPIHFHARTYCKRGNGVRYVHTQRIGSWQNVAHDVPDLCVQSTASPPSHAINTTNERRIQNCKLCSYLSRTFFPFYLLFCSFVSFKFLLIKYGKHFRHATIKQLSNKKERKKICKEIVFRVKITSKSNRGQNDPCYALTKVFSCLRSWVKTFNAPSHYPMITGL